MTDKETTPDVSLVIPTYNEAKNIATLICEVNKSFEGSGAKLETIVVDDNSPDGTAEKARELMGEYDLKVFVRENERGLATAVQHGWQNSTGKFLAVIDGDMQHPPDIILNLYKAIGEHGLDMAVASRKVEGGGTLNWEIHRMIISLVAIYIGKVMLPFTLWSVKDATTGCFMFDRNGVDLSKLSPSGFKIFLEVLVRGKFKKKREVGYVFNQRSLGESKMTIKQDVIYIYHLAKLGISTGEIAIPILIFAGFLSLIF